MDRYLVDTKKGVVYDRNTLGNQYIMFPSVSLRTGRGLLRYIQSLHQYQESKSSHERR